MSSLNNIDKKYNIVIYASFIILAIGLIYVMHKQNNLTNKQNDLSSLITTGPGSNTVKIPSTGGLYSYSPAYWWGYATGQTGGTIAWTAFGKTSRNISLNVNDSTQLILPFIGVYELTISGGVNVQDTSQSITMLENGQPTSYLSQPIYYNSTVNIPAGSTTQVTGWTSASLTSFVNVVIPNTYIQYSATSGITLSDSHPLIFTAKFISL